MRLFILLSYFFNSLAVHADQSPPPNECVILLHGLARTTHSMNRMADALHDHGYLVANVNYPSRSQRIENLSEIAVAEGLDVCRQGGAGRIHFVTHSLGGILVRYYLSVRNIPDLGRVVMLAPPNRGSHVVDLFSDFPGFELINGPAGFQLGTGPGSIPLQLGPADFELAVIAGDRSINFILSSAFTGPNDGKVAVENTKLEGMKDFLVVHHSHSFIMQSDEVIDQVIQFLQNGMFQQDE